MARKLGCKQREMLRNLAAADELMPLRKLAGIFGGIVRTLHIARSLERRGLVHSDFFRWKINEAGLRALKEIQDADGGRINHGSLPR